MARGPNLRLSGSVLGSLANPGFARTAGMAIGAGMLGAQRREEEADFRATEETTLELLRKAQVAQEQGDMNLHNEIVGTLDGMLTGNTNQKSRDLITQGLTTVGGQRAATQQAAQTNTAMSILKTQDALDQIKEKDSRRAAGELVEVVPFEERQRKALEERLGQMKQNGAAAAEAATIQFKADVQTLERDAELRELRIAKGADLLAGLDPESKEYEALATSLDNNGLGKAVRQDKEDRIKLEKAEGEIRAQRLETGPLSKSEMKTAEEMGLTIKDPNDPLSRQLFNAAMETRIKEEVKIAIRPISTPEKPRAEAIAKAQLMAISREGDYVDFFFNRDIATRIEDMSEDQAKDLMGRIAGLSEAEIPNEVNAWLFETFPNEMRRSGAFADKNQQEAEDIGRITNSILKEKGISIADATDEQRAVAQREAQLALEGAEAALTRRAPPESGGEGRRNRRGKVEVAEPYTFEKKTGTGGQMNRRQKP